MKRIKSILLILVSCCALMAFTKMSRKYIKKVSIIELDSKPIEFTVDTPSLITKEVIIPTNKHKDFLDAIGFKESGNRYDIVNRYGYMGKYQFGKRTLRGLGFKESRGNYATVNIYGYLRKYQFGKNTLKLIGIEDSEEFLNNSYLQEQAFNANVSRNKWILRKDIKRFQGIQIKGVQITESGILAAAHLAGAGNVKKYLRSGGSLSFCDAFGTSIEYYLKIFSGYDTYFVVANRKAKV